jgi:hypothetical protein
MAEVRGLCIIGEMKISFSAGRRHSKPEERRRWARRFYKSRLSQRDFAVRHGLVLSTLQRWLRQEPDTDPAPAFAEVKLAQFSARWAAEVVRRDGTILRLAHDVPARLLAQLLSPC